MATTDIIVPRERIERYIFLIRGQKVLLSTHLADLYDSAEKPSVHPSRTERQLKSLEIFRSC